MATKLSSVEYIGDQLIDIPNFSSRKMFGEYALYVGKKVVALVCDDKLFVKITDEGKKYVGKNYKEGFAYEGAKVSMLINDDLIEDRKWLTKLIKITEENLPEPKLKNKRKKVVNL
jgi:TfoX/Sxy family transcriptional regulator of competence genes